MTKREEFDNLFTLYSAIADIDAIVKETDSPDDDSKLDRVLFAIKSIDKNKFGENFTDLIISSIRKAIVELYDKDLVKVNANIGITTTNKLNSDNIVYRSNDRKEDKFSVDRASEALRSNTSFPRVLNVNAIKEANTN